MAQKIIIGLLLLIVIYFAFNNLRSSMSTKKTDEIITPSITQAAMIATDTPPSVPMDWKTISDSGISLKYPAEATAEVQNDGLLVRFMGQKQIDSGRTQTELFDGYILRVETIPTEPNDNLKTLSETEKTNAQTNCQSETGKVSALRSVNIDRQSAFQFSVIGCYIDYTESIVEVNKKFYRISQSYVGTPKDQERYKTITDLMTSTILFNK